jgi:hypothetical protein
VAPLAFVASTVRGSGPVVTIERFPFSPIRTTRMVAVNAFKDIFKDAAYDYFELDED